MSDNEEKTASYHVKAACSYEGRRYKRDEVVVLGETESSAIGSNFLTKISDKQVKSAKTKGNKEE